MYCLYVRFDYTYIDVNALAQGIKSFLASHVWFQAVAGARTYGTDSPAITVCRWTCLYVYMYECMYVCIHHVCGMVHIKKTLLLIEKSSLCIVDSAFPLSLSALLLNV